MTEQTNVMQDALVSIIQKTQQGIDASVSFLSEQIPDGTQQFTVITPVTVVLGDCDRRVYQHAKKAMRK